MSSPLRVSLGIGRQQHKPWRIIEVDFDSDIFRQGRNLVGKSESEMLCNPQPAPTAEDPSIKGVVRRLQELLQIRPVASAQFLWNTLDIQCEEDDFYRALPYCGYVLRDGPWKGALIRSDIDPRTDPAYRKYQTIYLPFNYDPIVFGSDGTLNLLVGFSAHRPADRHCHIFDGQTITAGIQSWQLCDITDDQLARVIATENYRMASCDATGYFFSGTWAKLWEIMIDKQTHLPARQ